MDERSLEARPNQYPPFHVSRDPLPNGRVLVRHYDGDGYLDKRFIEHPQPHKLKGAFRIDGTTQTKPFQAPETAVSELNVGLQDGAHGDIVVNP